MAKKKSGSFGARMAALRGGKKGGKKGAVKFTGKFKGKSNKLGQGGRAAQLKAKGVPGGVIGKLARAAGAAPGQPNFHKRDASAKSYLKRVGGK
jgi:hypothetical protein